MHIDDLIKNIFKKAEDRNFLEYIMALVRVTGIEAYDKDPVISLYEKIKKNSLTEKDNILLEGFWNLVINICKISEGFPYNLYFSIDLDKKETILDFLIGDLKEYLTEIFKTNSKTELNFIRAFLRIYFSLLSDFKCKQKIYKLPNFEVLELLTDENIGLYGFKMHFSNGSNAMFIRNNNRTEAINISFQQNRVGFYVGLIEDLKHEWRVGDKRLYELGLPGKYNKDGEWKPIIYPGNCDHLEKEAREATPDERIQGVLFYMFCTGHNVIEFVIKTPIKLPDKKTELDSKIYLLQIESDDKLKEFSNEYIYDCWMELSDVSIDGIKNSIDEIQRVMQNLAFYFDNQVKWKLKYSLINHSRGSSLANEKDLEILKKLNQITQIEKDQTIDSSINWYYLGNQSQNIFNTFLCYHIAIEGLAIKLALGKLNASSFFEFSAEEKELKEKRLRDCFDSYYKQFYGKDLNRLISEAYFNCVLSIRTNMMKALSKVFGEKHTYIKEYFNGGDCIWALRGEVTHGEHSELTYDKYLKVWKKLSLLQDISKSFIMRVIFKIKSDQKIDDWSREFSLWIELDNPNNVPVASTLKHLERQDWRIQGNWID
ncbi:MAG: hypothetical protein ACYDIA_08865 [Candidatus Humimicrobiaceae bacterium]